MKMTMKQTKWHYIVNTALYKTSYYKRLNLVHGEMQHENIKNILSMLYSALRESGYTLQDFEAMQSEINKQVQMYEEDIVLKLKVIEAYKNQ